MTASEPGKTAKARDHRALLAQATRPDLVIDLPDAKTAAQVFAAVAGRMAELGLVVDAEMLATALSKREESGSTGVGNEVAVPHALIPSGPAHRSWRWSGFGTAWSGMRSTAGRSS